MRKPFEGKFYTEDFDQEMLDYIKGKYRVWENEDYPFTVKEDNTVLRYDRECFIVTWVGEGNKLTKQEFKEKIGMTNKTPNTVDINMLKTGMIVKHKTALDKVSLGMVLLGTANGDIISGQTWGKLRDKIKNIVAVYQPESNREYLSNYDMSFNNCTGLNLDGCKLIWERKSPQQLEIDKLQAEVDERVKRINELKEDM